MEQYARMIENQTEKDLLAKCKNGNREAFGMLFAQNNKRVFSVALNFFGGNQELAEDITQQVFLKLFKSFENFRGDSKLTTWLYRITVNTCIDEQKKMQRFSFLPDFFGFNEPKIKKTQDEKVHNGEISYEVQKAIATLKTDFRLPILLKYVEGLKYREIAEIFGLF